MKKSRSRSLVLDHPDEPEDLHDTVPGQEEIARLEVAMDDARAMGCGESFRDLNTRRESKAESPCAGR